MLPKEFAMKKIMYSTLAIFLFCAVANAQKSMAEYGPKSYLAITAGPSFPIGDFASTSIDNEDAGAARDGYTIELKYGLGLDRVFGLAANLVYGSNGVDKSFINDDAGVSIDPWRYYGILVGPRVTGTLTPQTSFDFSVLSGVAFTNSPQVTYNNEVMAEDDQATTVPLKVAADFRFNFRNKGFLFAGASYTYMRPKFNSDVLFPVESTSMAFKQKMGILGINAGIGFDF